MLPSRATSTAVTAAHLAVPGGSWPQSRVVRYGCGRSLRGAASLDCADALAARPAATPSATSRQVDFMRESLARFYRRCSVRLQADETAADSVKNASISARC